MKFYSVEHMFNTIHKDNNINILYKECDKDIKLQWLKYYLKSNEYPLKKEMNSRNILNRKIL